VGSSNLIAAEAAQALLGKAGRFAIRPEKIRLGEPTDKVGADEHSALGKIKTVVYLGAETRFIIALDMGGDLMVTQQNLKESSMEALSAQGRAVRLTWKRGHVLTLADDPQVAPA
jgi:putative spermidine/putrescine transport system ATP-binding protein